MHDIKQHLHERSLAQFKGVETLNNVQRRKFCKQRHHLIVHYYRKLGIECSNIWPSFIEKHLKRNDCVDVRGAIDNRWLIIIQIHLLSIFQAYTNELFRKPCLSFPLFVGLDKTTGDVFFYCLLFWSNFFHIYVKGFQISLFYLLAIFVFYIIIFTRIECLACLSCFSWAFFSR